MKLYCFGFLGTGLIDVGGDDAKLAKLQATAAEVAVLLKKHPAKTRITH